MWRGYVAGALLTATLACSGKSESTDNSSGGSSTAGGLTAGGDLAAGGGLTAGAPSNVGATAAAGGQNAGGGQHSTAGTPSGGAADAAGGDAAGGDGGSGSAIPRVHCRDLKGYPDVAPSPFERTEVTGANGTFVDECDADGNVVEYHCPMQTLCGGGMDCAPYPTGSASPRTVSCESGCADGVCLQ